MARAETLIEMASRHVMEGDMSCFRQMDLIERMREKGLDTTNAESLLRIFEECLALSYAHLRRLTEQLCAGQNFEDLPTPAPCRGWPMANRAHGGGQDDKCG